jgi:hypothetical protein
MGMTEQTGDELTRDVREPVGITRVGERVPITFEEREVGVHARALDTGEGFRHERGMKTPLEGDLLHDQANGHHGVCHRQRVGVAQVDLVLARGILVLRVLDRNPHVLECEHGSLPEVRGEVGDSELEVRPPVERYGGSRRRSISEVEVLDLRSRVERETPPSCLLERPAQHVAGAALERRAVEVQDVTEDPRHLGVLAGLPTAAHRAQRQYLERLRVRFGEHVGFLHSTEAVDG